MENATAAEKQYQTATLFLFLEEEMKTALQVFYHILFDANPKSIGGVLPDEDFITQNKS